VTLALQSGTALVGTDTGTALEWFDGADWQAYTPGSRVPVPAGGTTLLVRVAVVNDNEYESVDGIHERFSLIATNTGGTSATGTAALTDDGSSNQVFRQNDRSGTPATGNADDDRPKPPPPPPPRPPAPVPEAAPPAPAPAPIAPQVQPFNSAVVVTQRTSLPLPERPPIGDILTSASGFRAKVIQAEAPVLITDKGITDQFTDPGRTTTFNLPADAFAHSQADAVLSVQAQLTTGQPLPGWIQFDAQAGTFTVSPPPQAVGTTLEIRVTARDTAGREAAAVFKFSVGEGLQDERLRQQGGTNTPVTPPAAPAGLQGRSSFSDQIRLAAAQRGGLSGLLMRAQADGIDLGQSAGQGDRLSVQRESATGGLLQRLMASRATQDRMTSEPSEAPETGSVDTRGVDRPDSADGLAPAGIVGAARSAATTAAGTAS
jgi:hypothetical protein